MSSKQNILKAAMDLTPSDQKGSAFGLLQLMGAGVISKEEVRTALGIDQEDE